MMANKKPAKRSTAGTNPSGRKTCTTCGEPKMSIKVVSKGTGRMMFECICGVKDKSGNVVVNTSNISPIK